MRLRLGRLPPGCHALRAWIVGRIRVTGFKARTVIPSTDVDLVEQQQPGFTAQRTAVWSSYVNSRLRKRYGNSPNLGTSLPLGQQPPALVAAGTAPPALALSGRPVLGSMVIRIAIQTAGLLGTAAFLWSSDGSTPSQGPLTTAASVPLPGTVASEPQLCLGAGGGFERELAALRHRHRHDPVHCHRECARGVVLEPIRYLEQRDNQQALRARCPG